jgi:hypothetical protein
MKWLLMIAALCALLGGCASYGYGGPGYYDGGERHWGDGGYSFHDHGS